MTRQAECVTSRRADVTETRTPSVMVSLLQRSKCSCAVTACSPLNACTTELVLDDQHCYDATSILAVKTSNILWHLSTGALLLLRYLVKQRALLCWLSMCVLAEVRSDAGSKRWRREASIGLDVRQMHQALRHQ